METPEQKAERESLDEEMRQLQADIDHHRELIDKASKLYHKLRVKKGVPIGKSTVVVLATSLDEGLKYVEAIGLRDYWVFTNETADRLEGLRIKAVVVTPGYLQEADRAMVNKMAAFYAAEHSAYMANAVRG